MTGRGAAAATSRCADAARAVIRPTFSAEVRCKIGAPGRHLVQNALAVLLAARACSAPISTAAADQLLAACGAEEARRAACPDARRDGAAAHR